MTRGLLPGDGRILLQAYGAVILAFMSGVLWGFAARTSAAWAYVGSVVPALYSFFFVLTHPWSLPGDPLAHLIVGFVGILVLDAVYQARGFAPHWWLTLRLPVSFVVVLCLWIARGG